MPIDRHRLVELLNSGKIVGLKFTTKRGELRRMAARGGVERYRRGGELTYDPASKGLVVVFDMNRRVYRSVAVDRVYEVTAGGSTVYSVKLPEESDE